MADEGEEESRRDDLVKLVADCPRCNLALGGINILFLIILFFDISSSLLTLLLILDLILDLTDADALRKVLVVVLIV